MIHTDHSQPDDQTILKHIIDDLTRKEYAAHLLRRGLSGDPAVCPENQFLKYFPIFQDLGYLLTTLDRALAIGLQKKPDARPIVYNLPDDQTTPISYFLQDYHFIYPVQQQHRTKLVSIPGDMAFDEATLNQMTTDA